MAEKTTGKSAVREWVETFVIAAVLAAFIMAFVVRSVWVDGQSMEPNFHNGERLLVDEVTYRFRPPQRGEVVVVRIPSKPAPFIKRVIGLPGDNLYITDGRLQLNGKPVAEPYIKEPIEREWGPYVVPPDTVFVMGDNRNNSEDSRFTEVGYVSRRQIVGRAVARYWPLSRIGLIRKPAPWNEPQG
ncbi:MAG: signal peptidase I [Chitinophagales bacterium]